MERFEIIAAAAFVVGGIVLAASVAFRVFMG